MSENIISLGNEFDYDPIRVLENLKESIGVSHVLLVGYCAEQDDTVVLSAEQVEHCLYMLNKGVDRLVEDNTTFNME